MTIIGLFDLLGSISQAAKDPAWLGFSRQGYWFAALVFFVCRVAMSGVWAGNRATAGARAITPRARAISKAERAAAKVCVDALLVEIPERIARKCL